MMAASMPIDENLRVKEEMEEKINLAALQQCDPNITTILATASQVALYKFTTEWEKTEIEGTLFVYSRSAIPYHGFMIMNRLSMENWTEPVNKELEFQLHKPFLLYRTAKAIYGMWFYKPEDCQTVSKLMQSLTDKAKLVAEKKVRQRSMSESDGGWSAQRPVDIMQMLNRAQNVYLESQGSEQVPHRSVEEGITEVRSSPVRPVPIKAESPRQVGSESSTLRPMVNRSLSVQHNTQGPKVNQTIHPVLQKLLSHPGEGAMPLPVNNIHTVESIEKLHGEQESGGGHLRPLTVQSIEGGGEKEPEGKTPAPLQDFFAKLNITSVPHSESHGNPVKTLSPSVSFPKTRESDNAFKSFNEDILSGSGEVDINQALLASLKASVTNQQPKTASVPSPGQMAATNVGAGNALLLGLQQQANIDTTKSANSAPLLLAPSAFRPRTSSDTNPASKPTTGLPSQCSHMNLSTKTTVSSSLPSTFTTPLASSFPLMTQADKITLSSSSQLSRTHQDVRQQPLKAKSKVGLDSDINQQVTALTKDQFRDAFVHLLQTDSIFVDKLFSSYQQTTQKK
ncbi:mRNA-decapping enzyme 1A-like [Anneissia japonica]|uniref:mRNA-decapping enzyme 1A-like n=1 Tax=Anneissia japonica TaxID=1529436 RepID=UPI0014257770|nr:mRNA-decapping enzyme 1A-like [Anneissia japonica]